MTYLSKSLLVFLVLLLSFSVSSFGNLSNTIDSESNDTIKYKEFNLILVGGGGIAFFGSYNSYFNNSPAINIGLEIPFTKSHNSSFELSAHSWLAHINSEYENDDYIDTKYLKVKQNIYSQIGIFGVLKFYILSPKNSDVRFYLQFGGGGGSKDYGGIVFGTGLNYKLNDYLRLQLDYRLIFVIPDFGCGTTITTPNVLMLNICYNFKW